MKRCIAMLLAVLMLFALAACGEKKADPVQINPDALQTGENTLEPAGNDAQEAAAGENPEESVSEGPSDETMTPAEETPAETVFPPKTEKYNLAEQVLVDNEYCTITAVSVREPDFYGPAVKVLCENKTEDKNLMFSIGECAVDGYMLDPFWAESVAAGKKSNSEISFSAEEMEACGITMLHEIEMELRVYNYDDWSEDDYVHETVTIYPTGLTADQITVPERPHTDNEFVVYEDNNISFVILGEDPDGYWGYTLRCYLENRSDQHLMFSWDDVSVNGFMIDPYWADSVMPGKRSVGTISFMDSDFTENGITQVENIEFMLKVYDLDDLWADFLLEQTFTYKP